jgi:hypothetical protein
MNMKEQLEIGLEEEEIKKNIQQWGQKFCKGGPEG